MSADDATSLIYTAFGVMSLGLAMKYINDLTKMSQQDFKPPKKYRAKKKHYNPYAEWWY